MKSYAFLALLSLAVGVNSRGLRGLQDTTATATATADAATQQGISAVPMDPVLPTQAAVAATTPALTCEVWVEPDWNCNLSGNTLLGAVEVSTNSNNAAYFFATAGKIVIRYSHLTATLLRCCAVPAAQSHSQSTTTTHRRARR
jgi:hypothetical protein